MCMSVFACESLCVFAIVGLCGCEYSCVGVCGFEYVWGVCEGGVSLCVRVFVCGSVCI